MSLNQNTCFICHNQWILQFFLDTRRICFPRILVFAIVICSYSLFCHENLLSEVKPLVSRGEEKGDQGQFVLVTFLSTATASYVNLFLTGPFSFRTRNRRMDRQITGQPFDASNCVISSCLYVHLRKNLYHQ